MGLSQTVPVVAVADAVSNDPMLSQKLAILISIPGFAETTAFAMLIEMPELGRLKGKQVASIAGLAPIPRQSVNWQGHERIRGGRTSLRARFIRPPSSWCASMAISKRSMIS